MVRLISTVHLACLLFLVLGFLLPVSLVYYHLFAVPIVILQWWFNNNQCILTQWQKKFEPDFKDSDEKIEGHFTRELLLKAGLKLTDLQIQILIYVVLLISWGLSFYKIL